MGAHGTIFRTIEHIDVELIYYIAVYYYYDIEIYCNVVSH